MNNLDYLESDLYDNNLLIKNAQNWNSFSVKKLIRDEFNDLTDEEIKTINNFWYEKTCGLYKPDLEWYKYYYNVTGIHDPHFIDNTFFFNCIVDIFNPPAYRSFKDKNYTDRILPDAVQPKVLVRCISKTYLDSNFSNITLEEAVSILIDSNSKYIIKPSSASAGGRGASILESTAPRNDLLKTLSDYPSNFVIQEVIKQHPQLKAFNDSSINTIRFLTMRIDNAPSVIASVLRIGKPGSIIDNFSAGGVVCNISNDGITGPCVFSKEKGIIQNSEEYKHICNKPIPSFERAKEMVLSLHKQLPMFFVIAWDICIKEDGEPLLIEYNVRKPQIDFIQTFNGPLFGNNFDSIIDMFKQKYHTIMPIRGIIYSVFSQHVQVNKCPYEENKKRVKITIKDTLYNRPVTIINSVAFDGCSNLKEVIIGKNITTISRWSFRNCISLKKVYIPESVKKISSLAFLGCDNLTIYASEGSYAYKFAIKHEINVKIM